ncbi:MAG: PAS domain-containing protein [Spirochaetaceae bacterium]
MNLHPSDSEPSVSRLLLVEDEAIVALATTSFLKGAGYDVEIAPTGEDAVAAVAEAETGGRPFDLVLMDIDLGPGIDGVDTARRILEERRLPIVFHTGHSEDAVVRRVRSVTRYGYVLKSSGELILKLSIEMALDLFRAHEETRAREQELEAIYRHAPVLMFIVDDENRVVKSNRDGSLPESIGAAVGCLYAARDPGLCGRGPTCDECELRRIVEATLDGSQDFENVNISFPTKMSVSAAPLFQGTRRSALVTVDPRREQSLSESREQYRLLVETTDAVPWEYDIPSDTWTYVAPQVETILGYPPEAWDGVGFWMDLLHPEDQGWAADYCDRCTARGEDHVFEYRLRTPDGSYIWIRDLVKVEMEAGRPVRLRGFMINITERRISEDRVAALLEEKEMLLQELTHRVKNNLTTLSSLLLLQEDAAAGDEVRSALGEARRRVETLYRVYALLNDRAIDGTIDLKEYLESLIPGVAETGLISSRIAITAEVASVTLPTDSAIALGMITNELVTNSIKHAFPRGVSGTIAVAVTAETDERCYLTVRDDGVGFVPGGDAEDGTGPGVGLTLVEGLARQIGANVGIETGAKGTSVEIRFSTKGGREDREHMARTGGQALSG